MDQADKLLWMYLINKGMVLESESYYGNITDYDGTIQLRNAISKNPDIVNWDKSEQVKQDSEYVFVGTFADDQPVNFLKGAINISKKSYVFYLELSDMSVKDVISDILLTKAGE